MKTEYTFIRYEPAAGSHVSGRRDDSLNDQSESWPVNIGQLPVYGKDPPQYNETSVEGRLGENHGGVKRPMDPVSYRTPD